MNNKLIITHKNCTDGCCAQAIFRTKYPEAKYLELDHVNLDKEKDVNANKYEEYILSFKNSEIYVADFCLPYNMMNQLLEQGNRVVILDHHDSNVKEIEPFKKRIENGEDLNIDITFCYDNIKSGTLLTWEYLYPNIEPPLAIKHVCYGDTWKFELGERTKHFYSGIMADFKDPDSAPKDFWLNLVTNENSGLKYEEIGRPLFIEHMEKVETTSQKACGVILDGKNGLMVEASKMLTSDLGNLLAKQSEGFGLVYFIEDDGIVRVSLRSVAPITVNDIAAKFGGGGHPQAAAFRCKNLEEFSAILEKESMVISRKLIR